MSRDPANAAAPLCSTQPAPGLARRFFPVWIVGALGVASLLLQSPPPELLASLPQAATLPPLALRLLLLVNPLLLVTIAALLGAAVAHRVGLYSLLAGTAQSAGRPQRLAAFAGWAGTGMVLGIGIAVLDHLWAPALGSAWQQLQGRAQPLYPGLPVGLLYGGIAEEVMLRWGLMAALAWALYRASQGLRGGNPHHPRDTVIWLAITLSASAFAAAHLPGLALQTELTPAVVGRTLVLNGVAGVLYGWLFWRRGLEASIATHACTHLGMFAGRFWMA